MTDERKEDSVMTHDTVENIITFLTFYIDAQSFENHPNLHKLLYTLNKFQPQEPCVRDNKSLLRLVKPVGKTPQ